MAGEISLLAATICFYIFYSRRQNLLVLDRARLPELPPEQFAELREVMVTAYQRLCYLGTAFLVFALFTLFDRPVASRAAFLIIILALGAGNVLPRVRAMRLLSDAGLAPNILRQRGIIL